MVLKEYIKKVKDNSESMLHILEEELKYEERSTESGRVAEEELRAQIEMAREELKTLARQKMRDIARHKGNTDILEETYDALIEEANNHIEGLTNQLAMVADATNSIIRVNRISKTVIEAFDDILNKDKLDKNDLRLIVDRILVYEDHIDVRLRADIDELLRSGRVEHLRHTEGEVAVNFNSDTKNIERSTEDFSFVVAQRANKQRDKVFCVNVISDTDPLEIYTDREGEVIFKKYSPIGELHTFAAQYADTLSRTCNMSILICDRDAVIAVGGVSKKEFVDKSVSSSLEHIMQTRTLYRHADASTSEKIYAIHDESNLYVSCAMPIVSEGDVIGCVVSLCDDGTKKDAAASEVESKLVSTAANFLGKQMES
jgi:stage V sporulation protein T